MKPDKFLEWTESWVSAVLPKIKDTGSLYIFATWQYSPEIFSFIKTEMIMLNEKYGIVESQAKAVQLVNLPLFMIQLGSCEN